MKILITGGAGFIGSNLAYWLLKNTEHEVTVMDNLMQDGGEGIKAFDVANAEKVNFHFDKVTPDVCYHLAAYAAEGRSNYIRSFIHHNNTVGAANVINACVNHGAKLIFTSSVAVYSGQPPFYEGTEPNPIDEYGLSKWTTEKSIQISGETQGLDWCIVRPRNVYGKYQSLWDVARNVMGIWMYQIKNNEPMTIFGDGLNKRCFTYVDDILEPLYNAINVSKEIINLGSPIPYYIKTANEILQEVTGYTNVMHVDTRHEVGEAICGTEKSEMLLNYKHKTDLKEGLEKMWAWAKDLPMKERQTPPPLEVNIKAHSSIQ